MTETVQTRREAAARALLTGRRVAFAEGPGGHVDPPPEWPSEGPRVVPGRWYATDNLLRIRYEEPE